MRRLLSIVCWWRVLPLLLASCYVHASAARVGAKSAPYALNAFVVAHADDWQLFMGDVLVEALRRRQPVLVIVTSAGDAARGDEFWRTRELGALASMRAALALAGEPDTNTSCSQWRVPRVTLYTGYSNVRRADNLSPEAAAWKAFCFVQYDRAMMNRHGTWSAYAENAWAHALYLSRTYARPADERGLLRRNWP